MTDVETRAHTHAMGEGCPQSLESARAKTGPRNRTHFDIETYARPRARTATRPVGFSPPHLLTLADNGVHAMSWPAEIAEIESFLTRSGLVRTQKMVDDAFFGNKLMEYRGPDIAVRVVSDRGMWGVEVSDVAGRPGEWNDIAILGDLVSSPAPHRALSLAEQAKLLKAIWPLVVSAFNQQHRDDSHARLGRLKRERAKRLFPGLFREDP